MTKSYLYHYTSLETLAKILQYKSFRLSSLSTVDDMNEGKTRDFGNLGRFVYVSCWTEKESESSSLWSEYTQKKGVRIKLPVDIFPTVSEFPNLPSPFGANLEGLPGMLKLDYTKGIKELESEKGVIIMPRKVDLFPVTYTEDPLLLNLSVSSGEGERLEINQSLIGRFKVKSSWHHQSEWRYKVFLLPFSIDDFYKFNSEGTFGEKIHGLRNSDIVPFTYFDLPVDIEKFKDMEIVMSSLLNEEEVAMVNELVLEYNPTAKIKNSTIKLRK